MLCDWNSHESYQKKLTLELLLFYETELKGYVERKDRVSSIDKHKEYIDFQASKGLTAVRIHQHLVKEFDFTSGYDAVRKYISRTKQKSNVFMVLNTLA